jgi:enoyl-CoA hydratase/carnithine racemase
MAETIFSESANGIHRIEIRRADKRNALTHEMYTALERAFERAASDKSVRVVLFLGAPGVFTAGNDIADFLANPPLDANAPVLRWLRCLAQFEKPVIAGVAGMAIGIGTTMLLHCDYVVASQDAQFLLPFVNLGLCPEAASSLLLPLAIGHKRASEMLLFGERLPAATALDWGLINAVVPNDRLVEVTERLAAVLAAKPSAALVATKKLLRRTLAPAIAETLAVESRQFGELLASPAAKECFAAFIEKRAPDPSRLK